MKVFRYPFSFKKKSTVQRFQLILFFFIFCFLRNVRQAYTLPVAKCDLAG